MAYQQKTKPTTHDVQKYIESIPDEKKRTDAKQLVSIFEKVTGIKPTMWGDSMIGFGSYHYQYESKHEGDSFLTGFAPRKSSLSIYLMSGFDDLSDHLKKLGKHKHSVSCLYIKSLDDIDQQVLAQMIKHSFEKMKKMYPDNSEASQ